MIATVQPAHLVFGKSGIQHAQFLETAEPEGQLIERRCASRHHRAPRQHQLVMLVGAARQEHQLAPGMGALVAHHHIEQAGIEGLHRVDIFHVQPDMRQLRVRKFDHHESLQVPDLNSRE